MIIMVKVIKLYFIRFNLKDKTKLMNKLFSVQKAVAYFHGTCDCFTNHYMFKKLVIIKIYLVL